MMKIAFYITSFCLIAGSLGAQVPQLISFQAVARNAGGNPITDQSVMFRLSIAEGNPDGPLVYQEHQSVVTNQFGLANLLVGSGIVDQGDFSAVNWAAGPYFLRIELDQDGAENYLLMGSSQLTSVPYALHSLSSEESGPSAYDIWLSQGNAGTEDDFLEALQGPPGPPGAGGGGTTGCAGCISTISEIAAEMYSFIGCVDYCMGLEEGGYLDWRLPTIEEAFHFRMEMQLDIAWSTDYIWSSTRAGANAWGQYIIFVESTGYYYPGYFVDPHGCRCVR